MSVAGIDNPPAGAGSGIALREGDSARKAALKKAVEEFEALFINEMMKSMRATIQKSSLFDGGNAEEIYNSMMDSELSRFMASSGGIGLGKVLMDQIAPEDRNVPASIQNEAHVHMPLAATTVGSEKTPAAPIKDLLNLMRFPLNGVISSRFGLRNDPFTGMERFHHGVDIAAKEGTPVYPAAGGRVIFSGYKEGYGNVVDIIHEDGLVTRYGHNLKNVVNQGDMTKTSEPIAYVGMTGRATGPHLHFEVIKDGSAMDPLDASYG